VVTFSLAYLILVPALAPLFYYLLAMYAGRSFFRQVQARPRDPSFAPALSILKPVCGVDRQAFENFASMCDLDYPEYEILFAVGDSGDPAIGVIEQIQRTFPERSIRLIVGVERVGNSRKVNNLCRLAKEATHDLLVINDSDVRVERDYLWNVVEPFRDPQVGLVTALFRSHTDGGFAAELDAVGVPTEAAPNALLAWRFSGLDFALGWTMAISKQRLAEIGGFEALANMHSDDFALGNAVAKRGYRIELTRRPVCMVFPRETFAQFLAHELRWCTQLRNLRLTGYLGMFLTFGMAWSLIVAAIVPSWGVVAAYLASYALLRFSLAWSVAVWGLGDATVRRKPWLVFLRDAVNLAIYFASFLSQTAEWRGLRYRLTGPYMEAVESAHGNADARHV
jgi:ceramide glucosyltransferase